MGNEVFTMDSWDDRQPAPVPRWPRAASQPDLRVSDIERDQVATELGEHFQAGRLDQDEFDERLTLALKAKTRSDLARLMTDLPSVSKPPSPQLPAPPARPGLAQFAPLLIPLMFVLIIAGSYASHGSHQHAHLSPLLWLWWLVPLIVLRARSRHVRGGPPS